jgi:hypothetical protein
MYERLSPADQELTRQVFTQLVSPGEGTRDTRRVATRAELGEARWDLVKRLADLRLVVTSQTPAGEETVEVVHEALIHDWRRLRVWMEADHAFDMARGLRASLINGRKPDPGAYCAAHPWPKPRLAGSTAGHRSQEQEYIQASITARAKAPSAHWLSIAGTPARQSS